MWLPLDELSELNQSSQMNSDASDDQPYPIERNKAYTRMLLRNKSMNIITMEKDKFVDEMITKVTG